MKLLPYITGLFLLVALYLAASCESKPTKTITGSSEIGSGMLPCNDTLKIEASGKAQSIQVSSPNKKTGILYNASFLVIEDKNGKILAFKSKDGWQIPNAEAALEQLIGDLEECKQNK